MEHVHRRFKPKSQCQVIIAIRVPRATVKFYSGLKEGSREWGGAEMVQAACTSLFRLCETCTLTQSKSNWAEELAP